MLKPNEQSDVSIGGDDGRRWLGWLEDRASRGRYRHLNEATI